MSYDPRRRRNPYGGAPMFEMQTFAGNVGRDRSAEAAPRSGGMQLGSTAGEVDPYGTDAQGNLIIKKDRQIAAERQSNDDMIAARDAGTRDSRLGAEYQRGFAGGAGGAATPPAVTPVAPGAPPMPPNPVAGGMARPPAPGMAAVTPPAPDPPVGMPQVPNPINPAVMMPGGATPAPAPAVAQHQPPQHPAFAPVPAGSVQSNPSAADATTAAYAQQNRQTGAAPLVNGERSMTNPYGTGSARATRPGEGEGTVAIPGSRDGTVAPSNVSGSEALRLATPRTVTLPNGRVDPYQTAPSMLGGAGANGPATSVVDNRQAAQMAAAAPQINAQVGDAQAAFVAGQAPAVTKPKKPVNPYIVDKPSYPPKKKTFAVNR